MSRSIIFHSVSDLGRSGTDGGTGEFYRNGLVPSPKPGWESRFLSTPVLVTIGAFSRTLILSPQTQNSHFCGQGELKTVRRDCLSRLRLFLLFLFPLVSPVWFRPVCDNTDKSWGQKSLGWVKVP